MVLGSGLGEARVSRRVYSMVVFIILVLWT